MEESGTLKNFGVSYSGIYFPGDPLMCRGKAINKYIKQGENYVQLEIWAENQKKEKTTPGTAVITLSS